MKIDREKVIKALELCVTPVSPSECEGSCIKCAYMNEARGNKLLCIPNLLKDALELLKEQQEQIDKLIEESASNAEMVEGMKELLKEQEAQKFFVDESGKVTPLPVVVQCKDCKHRPKEVPYTTSWNTTETYLDFPNDSKCPCQCPGDTYYSWNPDDDWFCADGERKEGSVK